MIDPPISEDIVGASLDDAFQGYPTAASMQTTGNTLYSGRNSNLPYHLGFRFQSIPIDQGTSITSATLEPRQASATGGTAEAMTLYGELITDSIAFTSTNNDITDRTLTSASTAITDLDFPGNNTRASWDIASIIEEIVGQGGWSNNNDLNIISIDTTPDYSSYTEWNAYDGSPSSRACELNVTTAAGGGGIIPLIVHHMNQMRS